MDYRIVTREAFNVVVKSRLFTQENSTTAIPAFWGEYYAAGLHKKVSGCMGICDAAVHSGGEYAYGIGAPETAVVEIPDGFELWTVPASCWAVFKCVGAMPHAIQNMWKRVYSEWLPQAKYELIPGYDIELYTAGDNSSEDYVSEIWIRVQEK